MKKETFCPDNEKLIPYNFRGQYGGEKIIAPSPVLRDPQIIAEKMGGANRR